VAHRSLTTTDPLAFCPRNPPVAHWWQATDSPLVAIATGLVASHCMVSYQWLIFGKI